MSDFNEISQDEAKKIICDYCKSFYHLGWVTGTGGGISLKIKNLVFLTPSGVQKELIRETDIFIIDFETETILKKPSISTLKPSECKSLFFSCYKLRNAGASIHSHSINAAFLTVLVKGKEFIINKQEMIKGIRKGNKDEKFRFDDTLVVPIIDNTPFEKDLETSLTQAIINYPDTNAVLVRRHGVYIWGRNWNETKTMAECYDYLFEMGIKMIQAGLKTLS